MKYIKLVISSIFLLLSTISFSQTYTIDQGGTVTTCQAKLFDSDSLANYQNNEAYEITFCSNGGGNIVNIGFATLFAIHPSDTLYIYDGNSTAAPLIGAYNNNNIPPGLSSTTANTSGCITLRFVSDAAITDTGFIASINCVNTCQPIDGVITTIPALINYGPDSTYSNICAGDNIQFSVSGTYPDNGVNPVNYVQSDATSTFEWALGLGGANINTQNASQTYPDPQGYFVIVTITDANGCEQELHHRIRTGIPPLFTGILAQPDTACFGDVINLVGGFNQSTSTPIGSTPSTGVITAGGTVTGQTFLPDGSGTSYTTSVNISGFSGQSILNGTDISEICMNIEHSYIGDLTIELECPNGTSIILSDTYASSSPGNTFLGDANDDGSTVPGIGMDYCFDLGAAFGTMTTENNNSNWIPSTVTPGNNILTPGDFQPEQSFNNLVGCPIDGNWSITITDNIGADNGYIFEWSLVLNPAINPNAEFYTVDIVDGIWLNNPDITNYNDTFATAIPATAGLKNYTFQITDEYGCIFDTIIDAYVLPDLNPIARPDTILCFPQQATLDVNIIDTCSYLLELYDSWGDGWNGADLDVYVNGMLLFSNITVPSCTGSGCTTSFTIPVTTGDIITMNYSSGSFDSENDVTIYDASGTQIYTINNPPAGFFGGNIVALCGLDVDYLWSPTTGLSDPTIKNPTFDGINSTDYTVTLILKSHPQCSATSDSITVEVINDPPAEVIGDSIVCYGNEVNLSITNATSYLWPDGSTTSSVNFIPEADTTLIVIAQNFCDTFSITKNIIVNPLPITDITPSDTAIILNETVELIVINADTAFTYSWSPGSYLDCESCANTNSTPDESIVYTITIIDTNGCVNTTTSTIEVLIPDLFIPTGFSPNGDGYNDVVFVRSLDISTMSFQVFDRWGGLVFETSDQKIGWDGTYKGKELDFGVYVYKFEAKLLSGKEIKQSGSITLFR